MENRLEGGRAGLAMLTAGILILAMFALYANSPALATHVEPELVEGPGNNTCADFEGDGQTWIELKVDPNEDGVFSDGTLTVTISNTTDDKTFDWSSNIGVDAVFVKAGNTGSYLYRYDPPSESTGDTSLTSPGEGVTNAISHISFCYDLGDPTTTTTTEDTTTTTEDTTTTTEETTTTTEDTTTTTEDTTTTTEDTTTTTEETTTTTEATTATTVEDEVLGTVVTSTTEATTTTVEDEVAGTHVLPFTGIESDHMAMLAMALLGGGILTLVGSQSIRHRHEE